MDPMGYRFQLVVSRISEPSPSPHAICSWPKQLSSSQRWNGRGKRGKRGAAGGLSDAKRRRGVGGIKNDVNTLSSLQHGPKTQL